MTPESRSKFRAKELAIVMSHYDVGAIQEIHSFRRGNTQSPKARIITETGTYLLKKRAPGRDDPYRVALAHELELYLAERDFCAPRLVGTIHSNATMLETHGGIYELFEYIDGDGYDGSEAATQSAGQTLQRLHLLLKDFKGNFDAPRRNYHDNSYVRQTIEGIMPGISKHDSVFGHEAELQSLNVELLDSYDEAAQTARESGLLDENIVCHADWHPGNLIFRKNEVVGVVDFDGATHMGPLADMANGCLQFSLIARGRNPELWPDELDAERARWFLQGYRPEGFEPAALKIIAALMVEALIAEAVTPIAATGMFAGVQGFTFLRMVARKVRWLNKEAPAALANRK